MERGARPRRHAPRRAAPRRAATRAVLEALGRAVRSQACRVPIEPSRLKWERGRLAPAAVGCTRGAMAGIGERPVVKMYISELLSYSLIG